MSALLCPRCSTTDAVRAEVFGQGFWGFSADIAVLLLPLAVVGLVAGLVPGLVPGWLSGMRSHSERGSS